MIIKQKILLEFDIPTISSLTYSNECLLPIIKDIINKEIGGEILINKSPTYINTKKYVIKNPYSVIDVIDDMPVILLLVDVEFFEDKLTDDEYDAITKNKWRLVVVGMGECNNNTVIKYDLKYVNIEIVDYLD